MLEAMYVTKGLKRTCMTFTKEKHIALLEQFCNVSNLCFELSDYKVLAFPEKAKGGFSNKSTWVPPESPEGDFAVFLAKNQEEAKLAKYYYTYGDHIKTGAFFGYPKCCVRFFLNNVGSNHNNDYILNAIKDTKQHDFLNNRALRYFGISLLSHFPCSLDCSASQSIAMERLLYLQKEYPEIAMRFENQLKSIIIYTEEQGVFFANDYSINGNHVKYKNLKGTIKNDLFYKLKNTGEINIISHNHLLVGSEKLKGDIGIMLFK